MPCQDACVDSRLSARPSLRLLAVIGLVACALAGRLIAAPGDGAPASFESVENSGGKTIQVVAIVNGEDIMRQELAQECLKLYGKEVLESLVNKRLILSACQQRGITIGRADVDAEIEKTARKFKLPKDEWLKMLKQERGINPRQYAEDIVWPTLALRTLAADKLKVTPEEIDRAYEAEFGEAVKARLIVMQERSKAEQVHAQAAANPEQFAALAKQHSSDVNSASVGGMVQPIRRHVGDDQIEKAAFALKPNEVSPIIKVGDQYVFLKCEGRMQPIAGVTREQVAERLMELVRERKLRGAAGEVFQELQASSKCEVIYGDAAKSQKHPGVAAIVFGHPVTVAELAEECISRHGVEILEGSINRRLLEQGLKTSKLTVTQADLNAEIARAALSMGKATPSGEADVKGWLKAATEQQGISTEAYIRDVVWPTVALKKMVSGKITVSEEDIQKGYEANFGPRVRCLAVVLPNQRKAQEVWQLARDNPNAEFFGELAEQYSIEPSSKAQRGRVPPIQRHGGQPALEAEAFKLQPGELSSVIQAGDQYIVLRCEGYTDPGKIEVEAVRDEIKNELREKKLRIAMAKHFSDLRENAQIDNFLAGTTQSAKRPAGTAAASGPARNGAVKALGIRQPASAVRAATATSPVEGAQRK